MIFSTVRIKKYTDPGTLNETFYEKVILHRRMIRVNFWRKTLGIVKITITCFAYHHYKHCVRLMKRIFNSKCIFISMIDLTTPFNREGDELYNFLSYVAGDLSSFYRKSTEFLCLVSREGLFYQIGGDTCYKYTCLNLQWLPSFFTVRTCCSSKRRGPRASSV